MTTYLYISLEGDSAISAYAMDADSGALDPLQDLSLPGEPSPMAVSPDKRHLYVGLRGSRQLAALTIDPADGRLSLCGAPLDVNAGADYVAVDRSGQYLFAAYYRDDAVSSHALSADGAILPEAISWLPMGPTAHALFTDRSNRYGFVPHVATPGAPNGLAQLLFDEATGVLTANEEPFVFAEEGQGPRGYVYHPTLDLLYVANEQGSSVTSYRLDMDTGRLSAWETLSTLPEGWDGDNRCAQIHIHPSGAWLYVSNRGHESLAGFAVDASGALTSLGQWPTVPTSLAWNIEPSGRYLFASGQRSAELACHRIDLATGALERLYTMGIGNVPRWVEAIPL